MMSLKKSSIQIKTRDNQDFKASEEALPKDAGYWLYCIVGSKGRGKSTILLGLLNDYLKKYYDNIYFCSTTAKRDPKFKELIEELEDENKFWPTFSNEICQDIMDNLVEDIEHKEMRNLVILDDCASLIPSSTEKDCPFNTFIMGSRHYKTDIILTTQCFSKLNTIVRKNLDVISLFSTVNRKELQWYSDELNVDKEDFLDHLSLLDGEKHSFLTVSFVDGSPKYFKNFDKILS